MLIKGVITIAETIKGINVVIGAETTGLSKALADVNKQSRDIQSELKQVERLLKLDPKNTELLAQKQKLLGDAVATTREKLDRLKTAQEQVNQQFAKGEISEGQYRAFQREVVKAEQDLAKLERQFKDTGAAAKKLDVDIKGVGDKLKGVGTTMSVGVTAPLVAGFAAVTQGTKELRGDLATLQTNAKVAGQDMGILNEAMVKLQAVTGETDSNVEGLSELLATGFRDEQLSKLLDSLYGASIKFKDTLKFEGIADGLQETLATGAAIGPFGELLERSGIQLDGFNAGLKAAIANGTEEQYVLDVLAKTGLAQTYEAYRKNNEEMVKAEEANFRMQQSMAKLGATLEPILTPIIAAVTRLVNKFNEMDPAGQKVVLTIAGIAAAIGPALIVLGFLASSIGSIIGFFAVGATGISAFAATMAVITGPIGLAVAAIAAITAGGIALYNHLQKDAIPEVQLFGEKTSEATKKAVGAYMDLDEKAGQSLMNLKLTGETVTKEMADSLTGTFSQMTATIKQGMEKDFQESLSSMKNYLDTSDALSKEEEQKILADMQSGYNSRQQAIQEGEKRIKEILQNASQEKRGLSQAELTEIGNIQQQMKEKAVQTLSETELESKAILERMRQQAGDITAKQAAEVAKNSADQRDKAVKAAEDQYSNVIKEIIRQRDEAGTISSEQADKLINDATRQRDEAIKKAEEMHEGVIGEAKKQAGEHVNSVNWETGEVLSKWEKFKGDVKRKWEEIRQSTLDIWNSISNGISNTIDNVTSTVKGKLEDLWRYIKSIPSQSMQWGRDIIRALVEGIKSIHIPLPHIGVSWDAYTVGGKTIKVPDFGLNWYAQGGIFTSPTVAGIGDVPEAVMPLSKLPSLMTEALAGALQRLGDTMQTPAMAGGVNINIESMTVRNDNDIKAISRELYKLQVNALRGQGLG